MKTGMGEKKHYTQESEKAGLLDTVGFFSPQPRISWLTTMDKSISNAAQLGGVCSY